jgi:hypothetical protein
VVVVMVMVMVMMALLPIVAVMVMMMVVMILDRQNLRGGRLRQPLLEQGLPKRDGVWNWLQQIGVAVGMHDAVHVDRRRRHGVGWGRNGKRADRA